jgi:hypothetical protein
MRIVCTRWAANLSTANSLFLPLRDRIRLPRWPARAYSLLQSPHPRKRPVSRCLTALSNNPDLCPQKRTMNIYKKRSEIDTSKAPPAPKPSAR